LKEKGTLCICVCSPWASAGEGGGANGALAPPPW